MITKYYSKVVAFFFATLLTMKAYAQDGLDIDVDLDGNDSPELFESPLFWVGVAVVIIILALIFKKRN